MANVTTPITYDMYEKITEDIMYLGTNVVLKMNVTLGKKTEDNSKYPFHNEYMYKSNKYINQESLITIKRSYDYFLSIENIKPVDGNKEFIMIRIQDMILLRLRLEEALAWFISDKFKNLFVLKENKLVRLGKVDPIIIDRLCMQKTLALEPIIINYDDGRQTEGVRMYLNSQSNYIDITIDNFMGFVYIISSINLYHGAQILANYHGRPEVGSHITVFQDTGDMIRERNEFTEAKSTKTVPSVNARQKSFFDKVEEL